MNRQFINQNLRTLPAYRPTKPPQERKIYLKEHINEAMLFYAKDLSAITHKGVRDRSMRALRFFYWMNRYYEGWSHKEIAFAMKASISAVNTGIRNTEAKIERYLKIKEKKGATDGINQTRI